MNLSATVYNLFIAAIAAEQSPNPLNSDCEAVIIFRSGKIFCGGMELINVLDQRIAFYIIRFGIWDQTAEAVVGEGKLLGVKFISHSNDFFEGQPFEIIDDISSMIAQAYAEYTISRDL